MIEKLIDESGISFWKVPKFIPQLFKNTQTGFLYCLLRAKRDTLIRNNLIKKLDDWFFYPKEWLENDLGKPNSPNHIIKLLKEINDVGLIEFKNDTYKPYSRKYLINDHRFFELARQYSSDVNNFRKKGTKKKELDGAIEEKDVLPLGIEDDINQIKPNSKTRSPVITIRLNKNAEDLEDDSAEDEFDEDYHEVFIANRSDYLDFPD